MQHATCCIQYTGTSNWCGSDFDTQIFQQSLSLVFLQHAACRLALSGRMQDWVELQRMTVGTQAASLQTVHIILD